MELKKRGYRTLKSHLINLPENTYLVYDEFMRVWHDNLKQNWSHDIFKVWYYNGCLEDIGEREQVYLKHFQE